MKKRVRTLLAKVPGVRAAYHSSPWFKAEALRSEQKRRDSIVLRAELHERMFRNVFHNDLTVRHGPFAGMRYLPDASAASTN
jgi:hypothetical protein